MSAPRTYLDHNATTPLCPEARLAIMDALALTGNPSAQHAHGRAGARLVEQARDAVALALGVCSDDLYFTGSGTEADNLAVHSAVHGGSKRLLVSSMDHPATVEAALASGAALEFIPAGPDGVTDLDWLARRLESWHEADGRAFVSCVAANSECGVLQPIPALFELTRTHDALLLVDAVQVPGKADLPVMADYVAVSAHKLGGPQGVGALYASPDAPLAPLLHGGGQERRKRAGTPNVAGIAGFAAAASVAQPMRPDLRDDFEARLRALDPAVTILGQGAPRLPNTSLFGVPGVSSQTLMMGLDLAGVSVSTGTACASGKVGASRAVEAMGYADRLSGGVVRVSFGHDSTPADADAFLTAWTTIRRLKRLAA